MRKLLTYLVILSSLLLSACGSDENQQDQNQDQPGNTTFQGDNFTITYPTEWEVITPEDLPAETPTNVLVGIRNNIRSEIFTANVNVLRSPALTEGQTLEDLAKDTEQKAKNNLLEYQKLGNEDKEITMGDQTIDAKMLEYEGKISASSPLVHFTQVLVFTDSNGFVITGAYLPNEAENVRESISQIINSFQIK